MKYTLLILTLFFLTGCFAENNEDTRLSGEKNENRPLLPLKNETITVPNNKKNISRSNSSASQIVQEKKGIESYGIYYGTDKEIAKYYLQFDLIIVQPYNLDLFLDYHGKKICYLSVGEFDGTTQELSLLGLSGAFINKNEEWNSQIMDMGNPLWQKYVLKQVYDLQSKDCDGTFLDTIWQGEQDEKVITLIQKIRNSWRGGYIIANNAHNFKNDIIDLVDGYMFENIYDIGIKKGSDDEKWVLGNIKEYRILNIQKSKALYAINYGDPFVEKSWGENTGNIAGEGGFMVVFADRNLTKTYGYFSRTSKTIAK